MRNIFLYIIFFGIGITSCHSSKKTVTESVIVEKKVTPALNGTWQLQMIFASDNNWANAPTMNLNLTDRTFSGNSGCNNIKGQFTLMDSYLGFDKNIISTKMACSSGAESRYEKAFLSAILKVNKYTINNDELELGQGEIVLMKFKRN